MTGNIRSLFVYVILALVINGCRQRETTTERGNQRIQTIIMVFDGLRPDYITSGLMPRLTEFRDKASFGNNHHSVFPTVTRVNASSYITGSYPSGHGIMGNVVYLPGIDNKKSLNTGKAEDLRKIMDATGHLFTQQSLDEILHSAGEEMFVYSSGSTGQAFLQNHSVNGAVIHPDMILPESFKERVIADNGIPPASETPNTARHAWITDALCKYTLKPDGPLVSAIWFSDPDGAAHKYGIGVPITVNALKVVDSAFGRILDSIRVRGLENRFNIIVTADHGFITHTGKFRLSDFLIDKGLKRDKDSDDVIISGNAIYVKDHEESKIKSIVEALQGEEWVGPVFTKENTPGSMNGQIEGTLSFTSVHWNHPERAADILISVDWNDSKNEEGFAGTDFAAGVAGHGGVSKYEILIPLIVYGPSFKNNYKSELPTSNIDIVPTILFLNNIKTPEDMQGRVMYELFRNTDKVAEVPEKEVIETKVHLKTRSYQLKLEQTKVGKYRYIDNLTVNRK